MSSKKRTKNASTKSKKFKKQDSSSETSDEEMDVGEVEVDFSGFEIVAEDSSGIQLLLNRLLLKNHIDLVELTKYISEYQLEVGSVIKETEIDENVSNEDGTNDDDTVYGLITVIGLTPNKDFKFIDQLRNMVLELSKQHATQQTRTYLNSILNDPKNTVGFLINERYLNIPTAISIPSFTKLNCEIEEQSKMDAHFRFTHYILLSKLYKVPSGKKKKQSNDQELEIMWCNAEDEIFDKLADARFEYAVTGDCDSGVSGSWTEDDAEMLPFRRVFAFSAQKMTDIVQELSEFAQ